MVASGSLKLSSETTGTGSAARSSFAVAEQARRGARSVEAPGKPQRPASGALGLQEEAQQRASAPARAGPGKGRQLPPEQHKHWSHLCCATRGGQPLVFADVARPPHEGDSAGCIELP